MPIFKSGTNYGVRVLYRLNGVKHDIRKIVGPDRKQAALLLSELKRQIAEAKVLNTPWAGLDELKKAKKQKTFQEAAADYMAERQHYKASTLASYESILRTYLIPRFGKLPLAAISNVQVSKFQSELCTKISTSRVKTVRQLLRSILLIAVKRGDMKRNPADDLPKLDSDPVDVDPLSEAELELVLSKIDSHYKALFVTLAFTGARPNELLALRWSDITWSNRQQRVNGHINICKGRVRGKEGRPKTRSSVRTIPMVPRVEAELEALNNGDLASIEGYVFTDKKGLAICKHLDRIWARALKAADISHRPSYQLRHTFASQCLSKGLSPGYVAQLLGHETLETTYRHYARFINDASQIQESLLREALGNAGGSFGGRKGEPLSEKLAQ